MYIHTNLDTKRESDEITYTRYDLLLISERRPYNIVWDTLTALFPVPNITFFTRRVTSPPRTAP